MIAWRAHGSLVIPANAGIQGGGVDSRWKIAGMTAGGVEWIHAFAGPGIEDRRHDGTRIMGSVAGVSPR